MGHTSRSDDNTLDGATHMETFNVFLKHYGGTDPEQCQCAPGFVGSPSDGCVAIPNAAIPNADVSSDSSDSSKDEGKYIVLFVGCFLVLGALVAGGLYATGVVGGTGGVQAGDSAVPTKEPKAAAVEMTTGSEAA